MPTANGETVVRVRLKGINTVRAKLADGSVRTYHYHKLSGRRLKGEPGTPEFLASIADAQNAAKSVSGHLFRVIIIGYRTSPEFQNLRPQTRKDYGRYLVLIEEEFGDAPIEAISDPRIRADFLAWRDKFAQRSARTADYAWAVLRRVIEWGVDRGKILENRALRGKRLYSVDRSEKLWLPEHLSAIMSVATPELQLALTLALYTGQRQGDLLRLSWTNYDGQTIRLRQSKTGRNVAVPVAPTLKRLLDGLPRKSAVVLLTPSGMPWKADHFRHAWAAASKAAGITDLHFHDLRGTTVTILSEQGANPQEIATITGHSLTTVAAILDKYSGRTLPLAELAMAKLEKGLAGTFSEQIQQNASKTSKRRPGENR
jgi:integrase